MSKQLLQETIKLIVTEALVDRNFYDLLAFTFMSEISDEDIKNIRYRVLKKGGVKLQDLYGNDASVEQHELDHYGVKAMALGRWLARHGAKRI